MAKENHNWKRNTLSLGKSGRKFVIDLIQMVGEEMASSSNSKLDDRVDEGYFHNVYIHQVQIVHKILDKNLDHKIK